MNWLPSRSGTSRLRFVGALLAAAAVGAALLTVLIFSLTGGRWMTVTTPSMGQSAPVGSLILSRPVEFTTIELGDWVVFQPPASSGESYTHRVVQFADNGGLITKGDNNGSDDPWIVRDADMIGGVIASLPGVGYLIQMLPILLVGGFTIFFLVRYYFAPGYRLAAMTVGNSLVLALAIFVVRPLVNAVMISQTSADNVGTTVLVPTGVLPIRVEAYGGEAKVLLPGELGAVKSEVTDPNGMFSVVLSPAMTPVLWAVFITVWSVPMVVCLIEAIRTARRAQQVEETSVLFDSAPEPAANTEPAETGTADTARRVRRVLASV